MTSTRRATSTIRYAFDETNRLRIRDPADVLRPIRILEGTATTDRKNRLLYQVTSRSDGDDGPKTLALDGTWKLTPNHDLALALHGTQRHSRQTLHLKGTLISAHAHELAFALRRNEAEDVSATQRLSLSGRWQADGRNRLVFLVEKADGSEDRLTLQGGWEVGKHHELLYRYRQLVGTREQVEERTLRFTGAWDVVGNNRLVYRVEGSGDSAFAFRASLQTPTLNAREGRLAYQIGIGLSGGRSHTQHVILFGAWKLSRSLAVSFEIPYANGRRRAIRFEGTYAPSPRTKIAIALHDRHRQPIGATVTFTRRVLDDADLFLRLRKDADEASALAGVQVRF